VTVAIVNYNGRRFLETLLPSLARQTVHGFAVHVVDDASTDDARSYVEREWPDARWLGSDSNRGITATMARSVAGAETEYVALLNNDLELDPRWLEALLAELEERPRAAAVEGKTLEYGRRTHLDGAGDMMRRNGYPDRRGQGQPDDGRFDAVEEIFAVSGTAALFRRAAFDDVGPYDTELRAYYEDVDWGFRARLAGYGARYDPRATGFHHGGATLGHINDFSLYHLRRNQLWMVLKNYPGRSLARHGPAVLLFNLVAVANAGRRIGLVLRAYRDALAGLPRVLSQRRAIQRGRRAGHRELQSIVRPAGRPW
jgi:GT2 family glycosyltransferase